MPSSSSSSVVPPTCICQYTVGPPLSLTTSNHKQLSYTTLHDAIQNHLLPNTDSIPAVHIQSRNDPHLLDCKRPASVFLQQPTILGVQEDTSNMACDVDTKDVMLHMTVQQAQVVVRNDQDGPYRCCCQAPHSDWRRRNLLDDSQSGGPTPNTMPPKKDLTTIQNTTTHVRWVDLRRVAHATMAGLDKSQAASVHFLRSLLGTSHSASPWAKLSSGIMEENDDDDILPSMVVLVWPQHAIGSPDCITTNIRVNDICPSYFLHATARVRIAENVEWWKGQEDGKKEDATLVVFRVMPEREQLHTTSLSIAQDDDALRRQDNSRLLPEGCLWETYHEHKEASEKEENPSEDEPTGDDEEDEPPSVRLTAPPYISHQQDYPGLLEPLLQHLDTIRQEAQAIPQWTAWPEKQHYRSSSNNQDEDEPTNNTSSIYPASWTVFPLCHCFPANCVENRAWIQATTSFVPRTTALLQELLGDTLRTALFSRLDAETTLEAHTGWADLANHVYRVHIPLVVPDGGVCGTWVDGCVETHAVGRPLVFDDSKVHRAFNYSSAERVVLILDLARPPSLPVGTATGGHTEELDKFIDQLT